MRAVTAVVFVIALSITGCQRSEGRYLARRVAETEVIGTWAMNPGSVKDLRDIGYALPIDPANQRIIFQPGGVCMFGTISPAAFREGSAAPGAQLPCRWRLQDLTQQAVVIDIPSEPPLQVHYFFDETKEHGLELWQYVDDPDAWRYVEYIRQ